MSRTFTQLTPAVPAWESFVTNHPQAHILQLPAWGMLKSQFGWQSNCIALQNADNAIVAGAQILYRPLPFRLGTLAYIPKGPLAPAEWWQNPAMMQPLWDAIHATARQQGARWLKVEAPDAAPDETAITAALQQAGFRPSPQDIQPVRTVVINLDGTPDEIMARMKQKTRYNIRLSAKKDVSVREGTSADVASFTAMMQVTGERDAFGVHDPAYYQQAYDLFAPAGRVALFIASYEGQDLAGVMVFAVGHTAYYLFGASTNVERNRMPAYGAQWAAIQWAMAQGCTQYDMWGVPDADEETLEAEFAQRHDGLWGVYRTKRGWGGAVTRRLPAWDYVYNAPLYAAYRHLITRRTRATNREA